MLVIAIVYRILCFFQTASFLFSRMQQVDLNLVSYLCSSVCDIQSVNQTTKSNQIIYLGKQIQKNVDKMSNEKA